MYVSGHDHLGDSAINTANQTPRHDAGLPHAVHATLSAVKTHTHTNSLRSYRTTCDSRMYAFP